MIHETAVIGPDVKLGDGVQVGAFSVLRGKVRVGAGTKIDSHVNVGSEAGEVLIGEGNWLLPGCCVGGAPQDISFKGQSTSLVMGDRNVIRECVTLNVGTEKGGGVTKIGSDNLFMAYVHLGHDCQLQDDIVITNSVQFAGHVEVESHVKIGGMVGIAQFVRLGEFAYIGGMSSVNKDILPFTIAEGKGEWARSRATNKIGLERAGVDKAEIAKVNKAVRYLTKGDRTVEEAMQLIEAELMDGELVQRLAKFVRESKLGVSR